MVGNASLLHKLWWSSPPRSEAAEVQSLGGGLSGAGGMSRLLLCTVRRVPRVARWWASFPRGCECSKPRPRPATADCRKPSGEHPSSAFRLRLLVHDRHYPPEVLRGCLSQHAVPEVEYVTPVAVCSLQYVQYLPLHHSSSCHSNDRIEVALRRDIVSSTPPNLVDWDPPV